MTPAVAAKPEEKKSKSPASAAVMPDGLQLTESAGAIAGLPRFLSGPLQRKLAIGASDDPLEREADRVADAVMSNGHFETVSAANPAAHSGPLRTSPGFGRAIIRRTCACGGSSTGECEECKKNREEELPGTAAIQRRSSVGDGGSGDAPPIVHDALRTSSQPLDASVRPLMESRFGRDFGDVRVHTGSLAAKSATAVNALAYTAGTDLVFAPGQYSPGSSEGKRLLAHELAHVVQQGAPNGARKLQRQAPSAIPASQTKTPTPTPTSVPTAAPTGQVDGEASAPGTWPPAVVPDPNKFPAMGAHITLDGALLTDDPRQLEAVLWSVVQKDGIVQKDGSDRLESFLWYLRASSESEMRNGPAMSEDDSAVLKAKILPVIEGLVPQVRAKSEKLLQDFDSQARANTKVMLENNRKEVEKEGARYGLTSKNLNTAMFAAMNAPPGGVMVIPSSLQYSHQIQEESPAVRGLKEAAKLLLVRQQKVEEIRDKRNSHVHTRWWLGPLVLFLSDTLTTQVDPEAYEIDKQVQDEEKRYDQLRRSLTAPDQYPVLGELGKLDNFSGRSELESIATGAHQPAGQVVGQEIFDRLEKIQQVQNDLNTLNLWKLDRVVGLTRRQLGIPDGGPQGSLIDRRVDQEKPSVLEGVLLLAANILSLILAPVTEGLSLVVMAGVNAAVAAVHVQEFIQEEALSGTAFDKAKALSGDDPSLFWLAFEIVGVFADVSAAVGPTTRAMTRAYRNLSGLAKAVIEAPVGVEAEQAAKVLKAAASQEGEKGGQLAIRLEKAAEEARAAKGGTKALKEAGLSEEELKPLAQVAEEANAEGAAEALAEAPQAAGGKVKISKAGHLFSCSSPCTWLREKYAEALASQEAATQNLGKQMSELENAAKAAKSEGEAADVAKKVAELEDKLRKIPVGGWESPLAKSSEYQELLKRRGSAAETLDRKPPGWTGGDEARFRGLPESEAGYHWRLEPDGRLNYVRESVNTPTMRWNPALNGGAGGFEEVAEVPITRAKLLSPEEAQTLSLSEEEKNATQALLDKRKELIQQRDVLEDLEETRELTEEEEKRLATARGGINEQSRILGEQAAERYVRSEFPGATRVYGGTGSRPGDFDLVYKWVGKDGREYYIVVEAKGGAGGLGTRLVGGGARAEQGTSAYFDAIADNMRKQGQSVGMELQLAKAEDRVKYIKVQAPINDAPGVNIKVGEFDVRPEQPAAQ